MRVPRVYGSAPVVYKQNNYLIKSELQVGGGCEFTRIRDASIVYSQNNYLNNSEPQVGGECEFHPCRGARQAFINSKLII